MTMMIGYIYAQNELNYANDLSCTIRTYIEQVLFNKNMYLIQCVLLHSIYWYCYSHYHHHL